MLIAIDGPAGAGKSTVARAVARALGFTYLDSGAMYRAIALAELRGAADPLACEIGLDGAVTLDGEDVTAEIRTPQVSARASEVASRPEVRADLVRRQRELIAAGDYVAEGRDIGTVVAPDAELKIYLTASAQERARRRAAETGADARTVLADQTTRDERDSTREHSPLRAAEDAVELDTTGLSIDEVVDRIVELARRTRPTSS
ncbi:MAG: CMP/dCMP kinase [Solirubrobacteraceae bacterium]|nr:CMP/dCMP kinase [Solirubrobacteraceae bacterium]